MLLASDESYLSKLEEIRNSFSKVMQTQMEKMWASKLGLSFFDAQLWNELEALMIETSVDYTIFFRELSNIPENIDALKKSFYKDINSDENLEKHWAQWLNKWKSLINTSNQSSEKLSQQMKLVNPKYTLREWFLVPAYQLAKVGDYSLIEELQEIMTNPYGEQSKEVEEKYYRLKPSQFFAVGGISHVSCSS